MHLLNAVMATRLLTRKLESEAVGAGIAFGSVWFFVYAGISCFLVLFAGIMSGLTLGLMSLGRVDLEILERSGTSSEKKQAGKVPDSPFLTFASDSGSYRFRFDFGFFF
jgi:metal transporter CNNM